jgi:glycosyltransferase involved in cell wall biosynthesis
MIDMVKQFRHYDVFMFFMAEGLFFPVIMAKVLNKVSVLCLASSMPKWAAYTFKNPLLSRAFTEMEKISYFFSDRIVVYSPRLISEWNLEKYRHKILIAHEHFLDFNTFTVTTPFPKRHPSISYIGRLSGEKGVQHFVQALPAILNNQNDLSVFIGGDGQLKEAIMASLHEEGLTARVDLPGWISHDDLPRYLNQLRLLVLPSYTEGLPNIMLEAMACGTPVLATPVGTIPDIIIDGKTGFIMENNSPECIAENVVRALNSPDLEQIAENGRRFVEGNFTFEKTVDNWKRILSDIE